MTAVLRKGPAVGCCRNKFQTQTTFKKPIITGKFSSHPLRKKKREREDPIGQRTRRSASLITAEGMPTKRTRNQFPKNSHPVCKQHMGQIAGR